MSKEHSPLAQFEIKPLFNLELFGHDISFTNSSLFIVISAISVIALMMIGHNKRSMIPGRLQSVAEIFYQMIASMIKDNVGSEGKKYFPFVFTTFMFVLFCNLIGILPYTFTVTSHIIVTFALAMTIFISVTIIAFARHGLHFFAFFLPEGTPALLAPLIIVIELFTYLSRPISLSIRLAANMMAGHVLLKVLAGFVIMMGLVWGIVPIPLIVVFTGFEMFVAVLQAYIFTILTCVYLNDAVNMH